MISQYMVEKTGVPGENHCLTTSHRDSNPGSGERQLTISGNALDYSAIRTGLNDVA